MTAEQLTKVNEFFTSEVDVKDFVTIIRRLTNTLAIISLENDNLDHFKPVISEGYIYLNELAETLEPLLYKEK